MTNSNDDDIGIGGSRTGVYRCSHRDATICAAEGASSRDGAGDCLDLTGANVPVSAPLCIGLIAAAFFVVWLCTAVNAGVARGFS
jgi:hypothetical protein